MIQKYSMKSAGLLLILQSVLMLYGGIASSQTKIQVITKTITKNISYSDNKTIKIVGEKAAINIQSWDKNYISATISLIAKHPNKKIAENEIQFIDYKIVDNIDMVEISNFFPQKSNYKEITSNLTARFDILVPRSCSLNLVDVYGSVALKNIKGKIAIDLSFAQLSMNNSEGEITIKTYYGDIDAENINTTLKIQSEMADLAIRNLSGSCFIECKYGNMVISPNEKLTKLDVSANRTDVQILVDKFNIYSFKIETQSGSINVPELLKNQVVKSLNRSQFVQITNNPLIYVNGKYGTITLKNN